MRHHATKHFKQALLLLSILLFAGTGSANAQSHLVLSKHADFRTEDRHFNLTDTLFILVESDDVDVTAVEKSTFEVKASDADASLEGSLENHFDGTFTAAVPLAQLDGEARAHSWRVEVEVEDDDGNEFDARTTIVISGLADIPLAFHLNGTLQVFADGEIVVSGRTIRVTDETQVHAAGSLSLADLVGRYVSLVVRRDADGQLVALQVFARPEGGERESELELTGEIGLVTLTSIQVEGITILVDGQTRIEGENGGHIGLAGLVAGAVVEVEARRAGGDWIATRIRLQDDEDEEDEQEQEVRSAIEAMGEAHLVVGGLHIDVTAETEFEDIDGLGDLEEGDFVKVTFVAEGGAFIALEVEREEDDDEKEDESVEIEGVITAVSQTALTVDGLTFTLSGDTRITGDDGETLTADALVTGLVVEVKGYYQADGTLVATSVEVEDGGVAELEIKGHITAKGDGTLTIGATTFLVTDATVIEGEHGASLTFADLETGQFIEVHLTLGLTGGLVATHIEVEDKGNEDDEVKVTGRVELVSAAAITVGGLTFAIDGNTRVEDRNEQEVGAGALASGQVVRVEGRREADGTLVATEIKLIAQMPAEGELKGHVTAVGAATLTVEGVTFQVTGQTLFEGTAGLAGVQVGQFVEVDFRLLPNNVRLALKVEIESEDEGEATLRGVIDAVEADALVVAGATVRVTNETTIIGDDGQALTFADLEAGMTVEVKATATAAGLTATHIEVEDAVLATGTVQSHSNGTLQLPGVDFVITNETLIVGRGNTPLTLADVRVGAVVQVFATSGASGSGKVQARRYTARRVEVQQAQTATGIENEAPEGVPGAFMLQQNYPNPFNPVTTIAIDVAQADAGAMRLEVYNLLGQRVATLAAGTLPAGRHTFTWDARDERGGAVASGVYLYRLSVGSQVQTRTMVLLK